MYLRPARGARGHGQGARARTARRSASGRAPDAPGSPVFPAFFSFNRVNRKYPPEPAWGFRRFRCRPGVGYTQRRSPGVPARIRRGFHRRRAFL